MFTLKKVSNPRYVAFISLISVTYSFMFPQLSLADNNQLNLVELTSQIHQEMFQEKEVVIEETSATVANNALIQPVYVDNQIVKETRWVLTTAYSSTPDQTDDTPFITASGSRVRDGIVACNFLRFGTKVRFPDLYGDKIFIVEDRMAKKNSHKIDIWFETRVEAIQFGARTLKVEILQN